jgi:eukaryotic-like serine/threonine-protein kinase
LPPGESVADPTTSSLDALKAYSLGRKALSEGGPTAALPYDQRAIQLDPNFATGHLAVGLDYASHSYTFFVNEWG